MIEASNIHIGSISDFKYNTLKRSSPIAWLKDLNQLSLHWGRRERILNKLSCFAV